MSLISFENVSFSYVTEDDNGNEIRREVLKNFNLNIEQGSFVAILGHNGSGKSTVAKLTNGILFADEGRIVVNGIEAKNDESIFD
ncbi:MAG: ATP-binding cassette domain-containing protein, partial [Eubacterium sp.]